MPEQRSGWIFELARHAERDLRKLPPSDRSRITSALETLASSFPAGDVKKLKSEWNQWRLRVGNWRIIFEPLPERRVLLVSHVERRDKAYR